MFEHQSPPYRCVDRRSPEYLETMEKRQLYKKYGEDYLEMKWAIDIVDRLEKQAPKGYFSDQDRQDFYKARDLIELIELKHAIKSTMPMTQEYGRETTHYIWRTQGDSKVRGNHAHLDGQVFMWGEGLEPGEDYGCRCWAEPYDPAEEEGGYYPSEDDEEEYEEEDELEDEVSPPLPTRRPDDLEIPVTEDDLYEDYVLEEDLSTQSHGTEGTTTQEVVIYNPDGTTEVRTGGTRAWRNNNPGNIRAGSFADRHGAIGEAGGFAVFPDEETGQSASDALLSTSSYSDLTVDEAIARRSPSSENETEHLQGMVRDIGGFSGDEVIDDLDEEERERLLNAIQRTEGWRAGDITYE